MRSAGSDARTPPHALKDVSDVKSATAAIDSALLTRSSNQFRNLNKQNGFGGPSQAFRVCAPSDGERVIARRCCREHPNRLSP